MTPDQLGEQLRQAMLRHGFTTGTELAKQVGVNQGTASRWLNGGTPGDDAIPALAQFLDLSESEVSRLLFERRRARRPSRLERTLGAVAVANMNDLLELEDRLTARVIELERRVDELTGARPSGARGLKKERAAGAARAKLVADRLEADHTRAAAEGGGVDPAEINLVVQRAGRSKPRAGRTPVQGEDS